MSTGEKSTVAQMDNLAFSLMSRMHVILRRQIGRVTDIDYMRTDPSYCRHLLELAAASSNEDLQQISAKLQHIYFGPEGLFIRTPPKSPLLERLMAPTEAIRGIQMPHPSDTAAPASSPGGPVPQSADEHATGSSDIGAAVDQSYVGRLR